MLRAQVLPVQPALRDEGRHEGKEDNYDREADEAGKAGHPKGSGGNDGRRRVTGKPISVTANF